PPGFLLFARETSLMAQPFDQSTNKVSGEPFVIADNVSNDGPVGKGNFSVSKNGSVAFLSAASVPQSNPVWLDRTGKEIQVIGGRTGEKAALGAFGDPALSPDETQLALSRTDPQMRSADIWIVDILRGTTSRFTTDPTSDFNPIWSPNGSRIAF